MYQLHDLVWVTFRQGQLCYPIQKDGKVRKLRTCFHWNRIWACSASSVELRFIYSSPIIMEVENGYIWKVTILLERPIFHWTMFMGGSVVDEDFSLAKIFQRFYTIVHFGMFMGGRVLLNFTQTKEGFRFRKLPPGVSNLSGSQPSGRVWGHLWSYWILQKMVFEMFRSYQTNLFVVLGHCSFFHRMCFSIGGSLGVDTAEHIFFPDLVEWNIPQDTLEIGGSEIQLWTADFCPVFGPKIGRLCVLISSKAARRWTQPLRSGGSTIF